MIFFPNAKINLGLQVISKREDGYHNIETVLYPIPLTDILEIVPAKEYNISVTGDAELGDNPRENLCGKAYELMKARYDLPPVHIYLHKQIPTGAGLGGGSSDASFTLLMLNEIFSLGITGEELHDYSAKIGSDCPFFIENKPSIARGRGTLLQPHPVNLSGWYLYLVKPARHISTKEAYQNISVHSHGVTTLEEMVKLPVTDWKGIVKNDFEKSVFSDFPELKTIVDSLYHQGAVYASMSGSGSTIYGLFKKKIAINPGTNGSNWWLTL